MDKYVKASELLKYRRKVMGCDWSGDFWEYAVLVTDIYSIPAADVAEVKHGEWVNVKDFGGGNCFADCSICRTQEKAPNPTALKMFRRYCPYCGARMDGRGINNVVQI